MRKVYFKYFFLFILSVFLLATPLCAQKRIPKSSLQTPTISKKVLRSLRRQATVAGETFVPHATATAPVANNLESAVTRSVIQASQPSRLTASALKSSSVEAEKTVATIFHQKSFRLYQDPVILLRDLWDEQTNFSQPLFPLFIRRYYTKQFGCASPHMETFFNKLEVISDHSTQERITKRLYYLAKNKYIVGTHIMPRFSTKTPPPQNSFRIRYSKDVYQLSNDNFDENALILSVERRMSPLPFHDFPIRHVNGQTQIKIGQKTYPVFSYNGPFDNLNDLYRFLLNGSNHPTRPLTYVFEEATQSLTLYNHNRRLWLRIAQHEFASPGKLHIHLNELRDIIFTDIAGNLVTEAINFNLSIPLAPPSDLPPANKQDFLYKKMVLDPIRSAQNASNATVEKHMVVEQ